MKLSLPVACALLLSLGTAVPQQHRVVSEDGDDAEDNEDGALCLTDTAGAAELSVLSGQNSSGHWLAKVRLLHAAGAASGGTEMQPVHLQLQRSAQTFSDGARTVALEATLSGTGEPAATESSASKKSLPQGRCTCGVNGCTTSTRRRRQCPPNCSPLSPLPTLASQRVFKVSSTVSPTVSSTSPTTPPTPPPAPPTPPAPSTPPAPPPPPPPPICICPACPPTQRHIPPGYEYYPFLGHYKVHLTPVNWFEAKATCEREGAHLVVINSMEEAKMVANFHVKYNIPHELFGIRIGFHDLLVEGTYYTVLGHLLSESGFAEWHPNEPNSAAGNEDCGSLYWTAQLNDIPCFWNGTFVCELPSYELQ